jgi:hypothetical protein
VTQFVGVVAKTLRFGRKSRLLAAFAYKKLFETPSSEYDTRAPPRQASQRPQHFSVGPHGRVALVSAPIQPVHCDTRWWMAPFQLGSISSKETLADTRASLEPRPGLFINCSRARHASGNPRFPEARAIVPHHQLFSIKS